MDTAQHEFAQALVGAYRTGTVLDAALWQDSVKGEQAAYAVQDAVAAELGWWRAGEVARYWKSGGPTRSATLTHAGLPPDAVRGNGAEYSDLRLHAPGVEAEVALRLVRAVTPDEAALLAEDAVDGLIDAMTVSVELVDSRFEQASQAPALLRLADCQSHAGLVLGDWIPYARRPWHQQVCEVRIDDGAAQLHMGTHSLGDPAWLLPAWLRHLTRHGATVPAGTVVTTGTWNGVHAVQPGMKVDVAFPGIGAISLRV
ncbi:fumarylacetoacetate hydrolase family protein [Bordetella genomosp. 13]|uniref:fumarylacetoacetate hydrolase family protein n=1 Tax=Bordetella genomosp. 13 TaxID=463040 RepID=UPI0021B564EA|nr:fumarylacetoacetate hydrolase family protein [Bordetella genomosp. 13]